MDILSNNHTPRAEECVDASGPHHHPLNPEFVSDLDWVIDGYQSAL